MKLIVGLGNPGRDYAHNRHNIGFICLSHFAKSHGIKFDKKRSLARVGSGKVESNEVVLARPQTYMNFSGRSVGLLLEKFNIAPEDLIVIHDDLDLPPGKIRIRQDGGSGGHKGINSIVNELDSPDFIRIRVGIGRPEQNEDSAQPSEDDVISYVLGDFTAGEKPIINQAIAEVSEAILYLLNEGLEAAMNRFN